MSVLSPGRTVLPRAGCGEPSGSQDPAGHVPKGPHGCWAWWGLVVLTTCCEKDGAPRGREPQFSSPPCLRRLASPSASALSSLGLPGPHCPWHLLQGQDFPFHPAPMLSGSLGDSGSFLCPSGKLRAVPCPLPRFRSSSSIRCLQ